MMHTSTAIKLVLTVAFIGVVHTQECSDKEFTCNDGFCIPGSWQCDSYSDCFGGEDEANCPSTSPSPCSETDFVCNNGICIPDWYVCDGHPDCSQAEGLSEDEEGCECDGFLCPSGRCIGWDWVCDGIDDCTDNSDEICETSAKVFRHGRKAKLIRRRSSNDSN